MTAPFQFRKSSSGNFGGGGTSAPLSCSVVSDQLFATPWAVAHQAPVRGILQARILEWVAISSRGSSRPKDQT